MHPQFPLTAAPPRREDSTCVGAQEAGSPPRWTEALDSDSTAHLLFPCQPELSRNQTPLQISLGGHLGTKSNLPAPTS